MNKRYVLERKVLIFRTLFVGIGAVFGITLMAWIIIQFCTLPFNAMSTIFFFVGLLQFISGFLYTGYEKSNFKFDESDYENVGNDETKAVVFF